ncbi:ATP-binding protein [Puniceibacterium sp. IMCC21224]|uniref:hybrid sensor histidine kinase/response regulator n=1 Tax=Puniceibacterium sp. IMCC21224 TaxID=1618204 RepID=UPI00065CCD43|nr:ATP-binding protein [Puniceibacterium sp. IMCC21224]KMK67819.1 PAS/PAC sensor hybrid histidine kinase [Puniceibacterium sp. IMCC21224]
MPHTKPKPSFPWGRCWLVALLFLGLAGTGYLSYTVWDYVRNLGTAKHDQQEWVAFQLEAEYLKLERAISKAESGETADLQELRKRFDIFYSRAFLLKQDSVEGQAVRDLADLQSTLNAQIPLIDGSDLQLSTNLSTLEREITQLSSVPRDIALSYIGRSAEKEEDDRSEIVRLIEIMIALMVQMTAALVIVILLLLRRTASLNTASKAAEETGQRLSAALRGGLDGIVVSDANGRILDFNGSAERVFGYSRDQAIGSQMIDLLFPANARERLRAVLASFNRTGKTMIAEHGTQEMNMLHQDGHVFPVEFSASLANTHAGTIFVTYIRDVTEKKEKEAEQIRIRDEALTAYKERSRFFAMMSHEMRTPLNGVLSALQLLDGSTLDSEQRSFLKAALTSGDILLGHINDVLAIERSENHVALPKVPCDIASLIAALIGTMAPLARDTKTRLRFDQRGLDDRILRTEPKAIQQILVNLLSNAIKFSPEGDVTLSARYAPSATVESPGVLHLEVCDTGIGIPAADLDHIFDDFVSLDSRYERRTGGTGLGLGIVRRFVLRLGGEINCVSEEGEGTSFTVTLPMFEVREALSDANKITGVAPKSAAAQTLLVVDDNEINRNLLAAMLRRNGHDVTLATGGQEAIDLANQTPFDAILMDISMPEISGTQATQKIQSAPGPNRDTRIIAVTAHALPHERDSFRAAGMTGFLLKPIDMVALEECLADDDTASPNSDDILARPGSSKPGSPVILNSTQVADLLQILGHDRLADQFTTFRHKTKTGITGLQNATDITVLQERAHALAGMCGMMGAAQLHELLKNIELACKFEDQEAAAERVAHVPEIADAAFQAWEETLELHGRNHTKG